MKIFFRLSVLIVSVIFCLDSAQAATYACKSRKKAFMPFVKLSPNAIEAMKHESGYWVEIQVPQRRLLLAKGSHLIKSFSVAVGEPTYPSPEGLRKINTVIWNPWWYPPPKSKWVTDPTPVPPRTPENPLGEIKMPLGENYLVHGTRAVDSIGRWASHGCIRMLFEDLFSVVQILMTDYSSANAVDAMEKANKDTMVEFRTGLNRSVPVIMTYNPVQIDGELIQISPDIYRKISDMSQLVVDQLEPTLKKEESPHLRKIDLALKQVKQETLQFQVKSLITIAGDEEKDKAYLEKKAQEEKAAEERCLLAEEKSKARELKMQERKKKAEERQKAREEARQLREEEAAEQKAEEEKALKKEEAQNEELKKKESKKSVKTESQKKEDSKKVESQSEKKSDTKTDKKKK